MFSRVLEVAAFEAFSYVCNRTISAISRFDFKNNILTFYHNVSIPFQKLKQVNVACANQTFGSLTDANHTKYDPHVLYAPNTTHTHLVPCGPFTSDHASNLVRQVRQLQREQGVTLLSNTDSRALLTQFSEYENGLRPQLAERYSDIERVMKNADLWNELKYTVKTDIVISLMVMFARNRLIMKGAPKRHIELFLTVHVIFLSILTSGSLDTLRFLLSTTILSNLFLPDNFRYKKELFTTLSITIAALQVFQSDSASYSFTAVKMLASTAASLLTRYVVNGVFTQCSPSFAFFNSLPENVQIVPVGIGMHRRHR